MDAFINALLKMSMRGIVIILIVLFVRFLLKKLQISHKYIIGLWAMAFLFFVFPWKLSLSIGFWNNANVPEEVRVIMGDTLRVNEKQEDEDNDTPNITNPSTFDDNIMVSMPVSPTEDIEETYTIIPVELVGQKMEEINEVKKDSQEKMELKGVIGLLWLIGLCGLFGHMLYSYFALKKKLLLSVLHQDNIWWAEDIDIPMVFGIIRPQIYLPISMESEDLAYVIAHEKMHIQRKDGLFKMLVYVVCLVHWFNPFIWIAYILFGNDMEKACDEEVIRSMGKEKRKEYAYALLHMAAESGIKKKKIFVAPVCFDEGNVKSRIKNIMKYKYTLRGLGALAIAVIMALSALFLTEAKGSEQDDLQQETMKPAEAGEEISRENDAQDLSLDAATDKETETLPAFYVVDLDALQTGDNFSLKDYHITSRHTASDYYYIDESGVLWGIGKNEFGQLGTGTCGEEEYYEKPVKIAEHVVSVDASWNNYFCIFLTESGELYGIGLNYSGLLLGKGSESNVYSQYDFQKVTEPVLLMTDVVYARAGMECIVALQTDQTAYWWGQYAPLTHSRVYGGFSDYWKMEDDVSNPVKMFASEPMKIMDHCRYITTGDLTGAAISETGELYTWGFNIYGQCAATVTEDDFVRTPLKVMDDVKMVWLDRIVFNDPKNWSSEYVRFDTDYEYHTFVLKEDDTLFAVGLNMGNKEKWTEVNGDLVESRVQRYGDSFVKARAIEYSEDNNLKILAGLEFGMAIDEAEDVLNNSGLLTFRGIENGIPYLYTRHAGYSFYFDRQQGLNRIFLQSDGSRDGRFMMGMSLSDLEKAVEEAGGFLMEIESDALMKPWVYRDQKQQIQYIFSVYQGYVSLVEETVMSWDFGQ